MGRLETCHPHLIKIFNHVVEEFDVTILCGHRPEEDQNAAFNAVPQRSKLKWPHGKHNADPSNAVDVAPWPIDWGSVNRFYMLGGYVLGIAREMDIGIRWGGDWDGDTLIDDQTFNDLGHFELLTG